MRIFFVNCCKGSLQGLGVILLANVGTAWGSAWPEPGGVHVQASCALSFQCEATLKLSLI